MSWRKCEDSGQVPFGVGKSKWSLFPHQ